MNIWIDTEFIEHGKTLELLSIGAVREDGAEYYAINRQMNLEKASDFVIQNVVPLLAGEDSRDWKYEYEIKSDLEAFLGVEERWVNVPTSQDVSGIVPAPIETLPAHHWRKKGKPKIWAWYGSHDYVLFSRLWGSFDYKPEGLSPRFHDFRQWLDDVEFEKNYGRTRLDKPKGLHNALVDARWLRDYYKMCMEKKAEADAKYEGMMR